MIQTTLLVLIGLALVGLFLYSLLGPRIPWDLQPRDGLLSSLQQSRQRLLRAIRQLRDEREAGIIASDEFDRRHRVLKHQAIHVLMLYEALRDARKRQLSRSSAGLAPEALKQVERLVAQRKELS